MSTYSYISMLSPVLFWDVDREHIDVEQHSAGLIQRVLEYGTLQDWRLTREFYGMDRIVADCKRLARCLTQTKKTIDVINSDSLPKHSGTLKEPCFSA